MFLVGTQYTRAALLLQLGLPDSGGGAWYTGLVRFESDHYIFCGINSPGRTGHDYGNYFHGPDLIWHGRTGSRLGQPSIQELLAGRGKVHVFYRENDRDPFTYAGEATPTQTEDRVPVEIRWSFRADTGPHPEFLPDELPTDSLIEGAMLRITVNVYERDPSARARCIRRWGARCTICGFDFEAKYGDLGKGYIHVHHLRPLAELRSEYILNPETDLRPVCPNCHAMLHRTRPALSIEALQQRLAGISPLL